MSMLRHVEVEVAEARAYLKQAAAMRRAQGEADPSEPEEDEGGEEALLSPARYAELGAKEQFVLSVTVNGYGKRTSAYEYRITGRGGQGIIAIMTSERNGDVAASFPVEDADQIMLITDQGQTIRVPVDGIRIAGRNTQGVTLFRTAEGERVVGVERVAEGAEAGDNGDAGDAAPEPSA
jgi:DNA gyrase subunit A